MNALKTIEHFAALAEQAGLRLERGSFEGSPTLAATTADHELLLDLFCELARTPIDRDGKPPIVADDQDADLLLHESGVQTPYDRPIEPFYGVTFGRQFSFDDADGDYAGMNIFHLSLETDGMPEGRIPTAQRWGYGGPTRPDASDEAHTEISSWAGHVDTWATAVRASNSWKVFDVLPMVRFTAIQQDV